MKQFNNLFKSIGKNGKETSSNNQKSKLANVLLEREAGKSSIAVSIIFRDQWGKLWQSDTFPTVNKNNEALCKPGIAKSPVASLKFA